MRDDLAERVEALERKASSLRRWVLVLSAALVGVAVAGASGPKELTLRKLTIADNKGKPRIVADTDSNGVASLGFLDRDGKARISAGTESDGLAALMFDDRNGKLRIIADTEPDGSSSISVSDSEGHETWGEESK